MAPTNLDMDVLRTFVVGIDLASFAKAATRLGRSPSAISLQLQKLEAQVGCPLVRKQGRGLVPTEAGEMLLGYARRLLDLNDAALNAVRAPEIAGRVRIGLPQDFAETWLPQVLARFARIHPAVRVEAHVDRNAVLTADLDVGQLDLALLWNQAADAPCGEPIAELPMVWVGRRGFVRDPSLPLPLAAFASPCIFRRTGLAALDTAAIPWRITFSSPSLTGLWAAVAAGLGITLRTPYGLPEAVRVLDPGGTGLPPLPRLALYLRKAPSVSPAVDRLATLLRETLEAGLHA